MSHEKEKKLKEIEKLFQTFSKDDLEIDPYVLKYLSLEALQEIELRLLQKREDVITNNHDWLQQFKKEI